MNRDLLAMHGDQLRVGKVVENARESLRGEIQTRSDDLLGGGQSDGLFVSGINLAAIETR